MSFDQVLRKVINGGVVCYDRVLDVIYQDVVVHTVPFSRRQVLQIVDGCFELTKSCNLMCGNCFSNSSPFRNGREISSEDVRRLLRDEGQDLIRVCFTGGEPFLHSSIEDLLQIPFEFPDKGFVITTNGTVRSELDAYLVDSGILIAVSLHGMERAHNLYVRDNVFSIVMGRIESLLRMGCVVHVYCVLNDFMDDEDLIWIKQFAVDSGVSIVRFIVPRAFGRYSRLQRTELACAARRLADDRCIFVTESSKGMFWSSLGSRRETN
jgi:molybdenum cofactor biosynthesis enzyme MoaA